MPSGSHELWTSVGFDNFGTHWVSASGKREGDGKVRMHGRNEDLAGPQVDCNELVFESEDEPVFTVYVTEMGELTFDEPFRMVRVRCARS